MGKTRRIYVITTEDAEAVARDMRTIVNETRSLPAVNALEEHCREQIIQANGAVKNLQRQVAAIAEELGIEIMQ
jgi:hypothetical protein